MRRIGLLICSVIALVAAGAMTSTAYAEVTVHLSKKTLVKGEKVPFTISGTEKGATYVVTVTAGDTVEKLATGTDPDGGKVRGKFKVPDLGPATYKVRIEAQVTQGGAIWLDSHKVKYSPVPVKTNTAPTAKSNPAPNPVTPKAPVSTPTPTQSTPNPAPTLSTPTRAQSTLTPTRRTRRAPRTLQGPTSRTSRPSTITPPAATPRSVTPTAQTSPKSQASPARTFAIPIGVVVAVGVLTLIALAGAEARLLRSPAEVGRTKREAESARLRALERAAERAI